ncbi:putative integral membrane protein [Babesia bovis T2Bo]|uniref:Membrane protein, putative n=1 Tax=Babesia bovis TaxID=5865 RepID=A7AND2_BABBO|nr:putative integral membrane protein [Babesia bovis T2Bo]EDO08066.1 putative integral membrane protein [Babesia bovis T2Bo]|eukprot:XP_001611634.1 membrane protein [Babesia bovis T2Bo]
MAHYKGWILCTSTVFLCLGFVNMCLFPLIHAVGVNIDHQTNKVVIRNGKRTVLAQVLFSLNNIYENFLILSSLLSDCKCCESFSDCDRNMEDAARFLNLSTQSERICHEYSQYEDMIGSMMLFESQEKILMQPDVNSQTMEEAKDELRKIKNDFLAKNYQINVDHMNHLIQDIVNFIENCVPFVTRLFGADDYADKHLLSEREHEYSDSLAGSDSDLSFKISEFSAAKLRHREANEKCQRVKQEIQSAIHLRKNALSLFEEQGLSHVAKVESELNDAQVTLSEKMVELVQAIVRRRNAVISNMDKNLHLESPIHESTDGLEAGTSYHSNDNSDQICLLDSCIQLEHILKQVRPVVFKILSITEAWKPDNGIFEDQSTSLLERVTTIKSQAKDIVWIMTTYEMIHEVLDNYQNDRFNISNTMQFDEEDKMNERKATLMKWLKDRDYIKLIKGSRKFQQLCNNILMGCNLLELDAYGHSKHEEPPKDSVEPTSTEENESNPTSEPLPPKNDLETETVEDSKDETNIIEKDSCQEADVKASDTPPSIENINSSQEK